MDLHVPIVIRDETSDDVIESTGSLDLASGEIRGVQYADYDAKSLGLPAEREDYEFTSGILSSDGKDVEFRIEVDIVSGRYSVSPSELLEIKVRAAKLFAGIEGEALLGANTSRKKSAAKPAGEPPRRRKFH